MIIHDKTVIIYDIESFPNFFCCTCKNTETQKIRTFEISARQDDILELSNYFSKKEFLFCGYNNKHYDDVIINYIIIYAEQMIIFPKLRITDSIFNLSQCIIKEDIDKYKRFKYADLFESMDLLTMMFSSKLRVGLKEMQLTMHYNNVLEYEGDFNDYVQPEDYSKIIEYNINDVNSTTWLFNKLVDKGEIDLRLFIEEEYGFNALSMDSVKFGETILAKKVCEELHIDKRQLEKMRSPMDMIPLKDVILPFIKYKNPKFQQVLEDMKEQIVSSKERKSYENKFVVSNLQYSIGIGGIHSINKPRIYVPKEDEYIGHLDVASMYPSFIVQYGWFPTHLGKAGLDVYIDLYHQRLHAKHGGQKLKNLALKLVLNSVTGKMQQETSWLYDPKSVFKIRINGQLVLLMLADILLQYNCEIIQVNTDGVMFIAKKDRESDIMESVSELEQLTKLSFEADRYEAFYQYAVNDYFGVVNENKIEKKGMFITENKLGKGLTPTIIPKAVIAYFTKHISIRDTIRNCNDIYEFLMAQRVDKKFKIEYNNHYVQRINRYYASIKGYWLYKIKHEDGKESFENMLTKSGVKILNKIDNTDVPDDINYAYYESEARKIINDLECRQLDLFAQYNNAC